MPIFCRSANSNRRSYRRYNSALRPYSPLWSLQFDLLLRNIELMQLREVIYSQMQVFRLVLTRLEVWL